MSRDFNKSILMGRLARDPDVRVSANGQKVARFTICTGREWKDRTSGEKKTHTDFIGCTAWGFTAELFEKYIRKGDRILLEGRISTRDYDDAKSGEHKWVTEVVADNIVMLGGAKAGENPQGAYTPHTPSGNERANSPDDLGGFGREPKGGFDEDFPLDFSELDGVSNNDVEIPF